MYLYINMYSLELTPSLERLKYGNYHYRKFAIALINNVVDNWNKMCMHTFLLSFLQYAAYFYRLSLKIELDKSETPKNSPPTQRHWF